MVEHSTTGKGMLFRKNNTKKKITFFSIKKDVNNKGIFPLFILSFINFFLVYQKKERHCFVGTELVVIVFF